MDQPDKMKLPAIAGEYIERVIKKMRYRRSVRKEVRQELTDHFIDALCECEDEKQREALAKSLIEEFGDEKILGVLLRGAKKRCRPMWRTVVARTFQTIVAAILLLLLYTGWFFTGRPSVDVDYLAKMNEMVRPNVPDDQNAWPLYKQAAEKYVEPDKHLDLEVDTDFDFSIRSLSKVTAKCRKVIEKTMADNAEAVELILQGNSKPYYWQVYANSPDADEGDDTELMSVLMPNLSTYRSLARHCLWRGIFEAESGDYTEAFNWLLETYRFGQNIRGTNTTLIEQLVAMAVEGMSVMNIKLLLHENMDAIDVQVLDDIRKRFELLTKDEDFTVKLETERLSLYDEAQRSFTESRFGKSHLYMPRIREVQGEPVLTVMVGPDPSVSPNGGQASAQRGFLDDLEDVWANVSDEALRLYGMAARGSRILFTHPGKQETVHAITEVFDMMSEAALKTPATLKREGFDVNGKVEEIYGENIFLQFFGSPFGKIISLSYRNKTDVSAMLTILAIVQYQKTYGDWPRTLEQVVEKKLLKEVPIDPFSDKPLVYRKTDDGFTLYSVGLNFVDDGGVEGTDSRGNFRPWADNGDTIFWPIRDAER